MRELNSLLKKIGVAIDSFLARRFKNRPNQKQLSWFVLLWLFGLLIAVLLSLPIKLLVKLMS